MRLVRKPLFLRPAALVPISVRRFGIPGLTGDGLRMAGEVGAETTEGTIPVHGGRGPHRAARFPGRGGGLLSAKPAGQSAWRTLYGRRS